MPLQSLLLLLLSLLALGQGTAEVYFANYNFPTLQTGSSFILAWIGNGQPVNVSLANGPLSNLQKVDDITINNSRKTYTWRIPVDLPTDNYVLQIAQRNGTSSRSPQFTIAGNIVRGGSDGSSAPAKFTAILQSVLPTTTTIQTMSMPVITSMQAGYPAKVVPVANGIPPMQIWVNDKAMQYNWQSEGLMATPTVENAVTLASRKASSGPAVSRSSRGPSPSESATSDKFASKGSLDTRSDGAAGVMSMPSIRVMVLSWLIVLLAWC